RRLIFIIILILSFNVSFGQQDPQVSHYFFLKEFYNPAYAGYDGQICANLLSHQQWRNFENAPLTTIMTIDAPVSPFGIDGGIGINFVDDRYGFVRDFKANISLAYNINLGLGRLAIGLSPGIFSKKFEPSWKFPEQTESILNQNGNVTIFDIGAGILYTRTNLFLSLSSALSFS
ncbi:MAG: PorP/SprF family type IX secretion system membrane protein, partial [Candidatus Cloacimonadota bacterium]|nr:PorP/SprF family type IX secretion system membrane protein [Candidatus Cloacimonadota bacterium]